MAFLVVVSMVFVAPLAPVVELLRVASVLVFPACFYFDFSD